MSSQSNKSPHQSIRCAASLVGGTRYLTVFTGAGISVESGIPPFRGPGGLWSRYDPRMLELDYFHRHPDKACPVVREIFYDHFGKARPNKAHEVLAACEARGAVAEGGRATESDGRAGAAGRPASDGTDGCSHPVGGVSRLQTLITQNVDNLHHIAGSKRLFW